MKKISKHAENFKKENSDKNETTKNEGATEKFRRGGVAKSKVPGNKHVDVAKGHRLVHGYKAVKGADKDTNYSKGVPKVKVDKGWRLPHGYETTEGAYNMKYETGSNIDSEWFGVDASLNISLEEYGFVATQRADKDYDDEYFVVYKISDDAYGTAHIRESELNAIIEGKEWADEDDIKSFLDFCGFSKEEWLDSRFEHKLSDLLSYWGYQNIMGTDYYPWDKSHAYSVIGLDEEYRRGGIAKSKVPGNKHVDVAKGYRLTHGYKAVKGSDKNYNYAKGVAKLKVDKGWRLPHGYEVEEGAYDMKYAKGSNVKTDWLNFKKEFARSSDEEALQMLKNEYGDYISGEDFSGDYGNSLLGKKVHERFIKLEEKGLIEQFGDWDDFTFVIKKISIEEIYNALKNSPNFQKVELRDSKDSSTGKEIYILSKLVAPPEDDLNEGNIDEFVIWYDDRTLTVTYLPNGYDREVETIDEIIDYTRANEQYRRGGVPGSKHVDLVKGYRLVHGYKAVKGADKNANYAKGVAKLKVDKGWRLPHGYEVAEGAYDMKYKNGGRFGNKSTFLFTFPKGTNIRNAWAYLKENGIDADLEINQGVYVKTFDDGSKAVSLLNKSEYGYSNIKQVYDVGGGMKYAKGSNVKTDWLNFKKEFARSSDEEALQMLKNEYGDYISGEDFSGDYGNSLLGKKVHERFIKLEEKGLIEQFGDWDEFTFVIKKISLEEIYNALKNSPNFQKVELRDSKDSSTGKDIYILSKLVAPPEDDLNEGNIDEFVIWYDDRTLTITYLPNGYDREVETIDEIIDYTRANEQYRRGGVAGSKHVDVTKGYRLVHGYKAVKGADKNANYAKGVAKLKVDKGWRLPHGYEVAEGAYDMKYKEGGEIGDKKYQDRYLLKNYGYKGKKGDKIIVSGYDDVLQVVYGSPLGITEKYEYLIKDTSTLPVLKEGGDEMRTGGVAGSKHVDVTKGYRLVHGYKAVKGSDKQYNYSKGYPKVKVTPGYRLPHGYEIAEGAYNKKYDLGGNFDVYINPVFKEYSENLAEDIVAELNLVSGEINFDRNYILIDGVTNTGKKLLIEQNGEFDMYGGPYNPKFEKATIKVDGKDIYNEVKDFWLKEFEGDKEENIDASRIDIYSHLINNIKSDVDLSESQYHRAVNHFVYFCFNYPNNFMDAFSSMKDHLQSKFHSIYDRVGAKAAMITFYTELDSENQKALLSWAMNNYKGTKLEEGGMLDVDVLSSFDIMKKGSNVNAKSSYVMLKGNRAYCGVHDKTYSEAVETAKSHACNSDMIIKGEMIWTNGRVKGIRLDDGTEMIYEQYEREFFTEPQLNQLKKISKRK